MEIDDGCHFHVPQSVEEPNFDAHVAAIQLQDCDDNQRGHIMEDSDYEYEYYTITLFCTE